MLKTGWLSPDGELYECSSYDHVSTAHEIIDRFNIACGLDDKLRTIPDDDILLQHGWVYIGISCFLCHEWRIGWTKFLTEYQKEFLRPYFEDEIKVNSLAVDRWNTEVYDVK